MNRRKAWNLRKYADHLPVLDAGQSPVRAQHIHASIAGGDCGGGVVRRQAFLHGQGRDLCVPETIEPIGGPHPEIALAIFKKSIDVVIRQALGRIEACYGVSIHAHQARRTGAYPEIVLAVFEDLVDPFAQDTRPERLQSSWVLMKTKE